MTNTVQSNANAVTKSGEKTYLISTYTGQSPVLWVWEAGKTPVEYSLEKIPANTSCGEIMADGAFLYVSVLQTGESEADVFFAPQNDPTDLTKKTQMANSASYLNKQKLCANSTSDMRAVPACEICKTGWRKIRSKRFSENQNGQRRLSRVSMCTDLVAWSKKLRH